MSWRNLLACSPNLAMSLCLVCSPQAVSQEMGKATVALRINQVEESFSGAVLVFDGPTPKEVAYGLPPDRDINVGRAPGGVLVRIERLKDARHSCRLQVDSNGDGQFDDEASHVVVPGSSVGVSVDRTWPNGTRHSLPYAINYDREVSPGSPIEESFFWTAHYRSEGRLRFRGCEALLVIWDINGDGAFDDDSRRGTNLSLDRNGDGRIWGREEYLKGGQVVEFCDGAFLVDGIAADGTSLVLVDTPLRIPRVGDEVPAFTVTTIEGTPLCSREMRGRVHLLEFWASWCRPCVEKFPLVRALEEDFKGELAIVAINVDEESRVPMALQIIKDKQLKWPHVVSGRGDSDTVWKMFGGMAGNRLSIPLYVLVDRNGKLSYAGNGGGESNELRTTLSALLKTSRVGNMDWTLRRLSPTLSSPPSNLTVPHPTPTKLESQNTPIGGRHTGS